MRRKEKFKKAFRKLDTKTKIKVYKQIDKIEANPFVGKPIRYDRKSTRELYIKPYRLSYRYKNDVIELLALYHKDEQ